MEDDIVELGLWRPEGEAEPTIEVLPAIFADRGLPVMPVGGRLVMKDPPLVNPPAATEVPVGGRTVEV